MAKFNYRMQNILDIKYKLEDNAKQAYADALIELREQENKLEELHNRKALYYKAYQESIIGALKFREIEEDANAMDIMDMMIEEQKQVVRDYSKKLEKRRQELNFAMQERKMHEKLREKQFDVFLDELSIQETKEIDEVVSFQYGDESRRVEG